jgi:sugar transferase EpsL
VTGALHRPGDIADLACVMERAVSGPEWRTALGRRARERAIREFSKKIVTGALLDHYEMTLKGAVGSPAHVDRRRRITQAAKRTLDVAGSAAGLLLCAPAMLIVAAWIRISMGAPVLFRQKRPGLNGQRFTFYKFRTMTNERDTEGNLLPDEKRLMRLGRFLRASSLDELPQLWNVLKGDMSLVGPRPLLPEYLPRYNEFQRRRHEVKPGITGWAQVNGRNALSWKEKFELDVWYVDNRSLWLDLRILWLTALRVLRPEGISQAGHATMPEFRGTE